MQPYADRLTRLIVVSPYTERSRSDFNRASLVS